VVETVKVFQLPCRENVFFHRERVCFGREKVCLPEKSVVCREKKRFPRGAEERCRGFMKRFPSQREMRYGGRRGKRLGKRSSGGEEEKNRVVFTTYR
jgi:hypothetical protein